MRVPADVRCVHASEHVDLDRLLHRDDVQAGDHLEAVRHLVRPQDDVLEDGIEPLDESLRHVAVSGKPVHRGRADPAHPFPEHGRPTRGDPLRPDVRAAERQGVHQRGGEGPRPELQGEPPAPCVRRQLGLEETRDDLRD